MEENVVLHNASVMFDNPNAIFKVGKDQRLTTIAKYNLIGRFVEWVKDRVFGGKQEKDDVIKNTVTALVSYLEKNPKFFYFPDQEKPKKLSFSIVTRIIYTHKHTLDQFADKISTSKINKRVNAETLDGVL